MDHTLHTKKEQGSLGIHDLALRNKCLLRKCLCKNINEDGICQRFFLRNTDPNTPIYACALNTMNTCKQPYIYERFRETKPSYPRDWWSHHWRLPVDDRLPTTERIVQLNPWNNNMSTHTELSTQNLSNRTIAQVKKKPSDSQFWKCLMGV